MAGQCLKLIAKAGVETRLSQTSSQHDWGSSKIIVHDSTLQNYVYPSPRSPSIDASQETEASKINLDRSTENPRPSYARACMATPRKKHMDISDEFELFEAPSESPIPAESKRNPRPATPLGAATARRRPVWMLRVARPAGLWLRLTIVILILMNCLMHFKHW